MSLYVSLIEKRKVIELVYSIIKNTDDRNATSKYIEAQIIGTTNKKYIKYAIRHLMSEGKIKRIKGFGPDSGRIEYYYKSVAG
jgi:linker histone H1 and H5 family